MSIAREAARMVWREATRDTSDKILTVFMLWIFASGLMQMSWPGLIQAFLVPHYFIALGWRGMACDAQDHAAIAMKYARDAQRVARQVLEERE